MASKKYKAKNSVTGETISFDWDGAKPPTPDDVDRISDQQRQSRVTELESKGTSMPHEGFWGGLLDTGAKALTTATNTLGLDQPWRPVQGFKDVGTGLEKMVFGQSAYGHPGIEPQPAGEQFPRLGGLVQTAQGLLKVAGPVGTVIGAAAAPEAVLPAVAAGSLASRGIESVLPDTLPPEVKGAISTATGLAAGGLAGHAGPRIFSRGGVPPLTPIPDVPPVAETQVLRRPIRNFQQTPPRPESVIVNEGPRKLPPGKPQAVPPRPTPATQPAATVQPPAQQLPPAIPDVQPVMPRSPMLPSGGQQLQLPEVSPIQMGPAPIRMPAAGTYQATEGNLPNVPALPGPGINQRRLPAPETPSSVQDVPSVTPAVTPEPPAAQPPMAAQPPAISEPQATPKPAQELPPVAPFESGALPRPIKPVSQMLRNVEPLQPSQQVRSAPERMPAAAPEPEAPVSPKRTERISQLQSMLNDSKDDPAQQKMFKEHLDQENQFANIERNGTPKQKAQLAEADSMGEEIKALEDKEDSGGPLQPEDTQRLRKLYQRLNALDIQSFFSSEEGSDPSVEPRPGDISQRPFLSRLWYTTKNVVPGPGMADVRGYAAKVGSPNRVLAESGIPGAVEIGRGTPMTEVEKYKWLGTTMREGAGHLKGLNDQQLAAIPDALEGKIFADPQVMGAAQNIRQQLNKIRGQLPVRSSGQDVGNLSDYIPHLRKQFEGDGWMQNTIDDALEHHLSPAMATANLFTRTPITDMSASPRPLEYGDVKVNDPAMMRERTGQRTEYSKDIKKILPAYYRMAAKAIYDKPWIDEAREHLNRIPDQSATAKSLALDYLRNYADTSDGYEGVKSKWDQFTGSLMRAHARAALGLSSRLTTLHLSRTLGQMYPEVPTKYFVKGVGNTIKDPIGTYQDLGRRGILPSNTTPWLFKNYGEKLDVPLQLGNIGDALPDAIGWHGLNEMYKDKGYDTVTAGNMAADRVMDISARSTPARMQRMFDTHGPLRPLTQYKQQIFKIAEQYAVQVPRALKGSIKGQEKAANLGKLLKYTTGVGTLLALKEQAGLTSWHLKPMDLIKFGGGVYGTFLKALKDGADGNVEKALTDLGLMFVPGSNEIKHVVETGKPSMFEK